MARHENREKADSVLRALRITEAPVDVKRVAEFLGFMVAEYKFSDGTKGMVTHEEDLGIRAIGVNSAHPAYLQRYTIAHELGHYLNGHEHKGKQFIEDDTRFFDSGFQQEKEADLFASELLMPVEFLKKDLSVIGLDIKKLIEKYQVSEQAMWIRLTSLRLAERYPAKDSAEPEAKDKTN